MKRNTTQNHDHSDNEDEAIEMLVRMGPSSIPDLIQAFKNDPSIAEIVLKTLQRLDLSGDENLRKNVAGQLITLIFTSIGIADDSDLFFDTIAMLAGESFYKDVFEQIELDWKKMVPEGPIAKILFKIKPSHKALYYWSRRVSQEQHRYTDGHLVFTYGDIASRFAARIDDVELLKRIATILWRVGEWDGLEAVTNRLDVIRSQSNPPEDPLRRILPPLWRKRFELVSLGFVLSLLAGIEVVLASSLFVGTVIKILPASWQTSVITPIILIAICGAILWPITQTINAINRRLKNLKATKNDVQV